MRELPFILADSDIEIVFGIIVFVIWVLSALAGKLKKQPQRKAGEPQAETGMERLQREVIERLRQMHGPDALPPPPPPRHVPPPLPPQNRPLPGRAMPPKAPPRVAKAKQFKQPKVRKQPIQVFSEMPPPLPIERVVVPIAAPAVQRPTAPTVNATAIRNWMKPTTLQKQFILTELFQPPMSMRENR